MGGFSRMSNPYSDYKKTGMDKMLALAKTLCRLVNAFETIIINVFPDSPAIILLMGAIKNVCALLPEAEGEFLQWQLDQTLPPADAGDISGINPDAPAAIDPDFV
jgi:hypothetical protein